MAAIGGMNTPVSYQELTTTPDGAGGTTGTWATKFTFMAEVKPMSGYRRLEYSQIIKGNPYQITTHYRTDISAKGRLIVNGTEIAIHSVVNVGMQNKVIEIIGNDGA